MDEEVIDLRESQRSGRRETCLFMTSSNRFQLQLPALSFLLPFPSLIFSSYSLPMVLDSNPFKTKPRV